MMYVILITVFVRLLDLYCWYFRIYAYKTVQIHCVTVEKYESITFVIWWLSRTHVGKLSLLTTSWWKYDM